MWNYLKSLFCKNTPEVIEEKPEKKLDISEPVISFVETYKNNPKRFKLVVNVREIRDDVFKQECILIDKITSNCFYYELDYWLDYPQGVGKVVGIEFLTYDEIEFIVKNITTIYNKRLQDIRIYKKTKQRNRYIKDYCKEN